jgi:hypothetical protein
VRKSARGERPEVPNVHQRIGRYDAHLLEKLMTLSKFSLGVKKSRGKHPYAKTEWASRLQPTHLFGTTTDALSFCKMAK